MVGRTVVSLVAVLSVVYVGTASAASGPAEVAREQARKLAKAGRTFEAATELRGAAAVAGVEGPALRFEAALMLQRSGEFQDAQTLHREVSTDSTAKFGLRAQARYAAETLFWVLEFSALAAPSLDRLGSLRQKVAATGRRVAESESDGKDQASRLRVATEQVVSSRKSLQALVGPDDPMIKELETLLKACDSQKQAVARAKKAVGESGRLIGGARRTLNKVGKGIDALAAFAADHAARAKRGEGKLTVLKKQHDELLKKGAKVAGAATGNMSSVVQTLVRVDAVLAEAERGAQAVAGVIDAAEIVLQGTR